MLKKHMIFILTIMLAICLGGCSFSLGRNNENNTPVDNTSNTNETNVNMQFYEVAQKMIVNDLLEIVTIGSCGGGYEYKFDNTTKLTVDNLNDNEKFTIAYKNLVKKNGIFVNGFTKDRIIEEIKYIFDTNVNLSNNLSNIYTMTVYELNEIGIYNSVPSGGACGGSSLYALDNYDVKDNLIFFNVIRYTSGPSASYTNENPIAEISNDNNENIFKFEATGSDNIETKVKENKDKFTQYRFNFKLSEDHYVFDSIEKIN